MTLDATFWVTVSFFIFVGILIYFKIPQKVKEILEQNILSIKNQIDEAEKLKEDAKNILTEHERKISNSKREVKEMIGKANEEAEKNVINANKTFHNFMENKRKNAEERIRQLKNQAEKDIKISNLINWTIFRVPMIVSRERLGILSLLFDRLNQIFVDSEPIHFYYFYQLLNR